MLLIADSGSTKTDWAVVSDNEVTEFQTTGMHPKYIKESEVREQIDLAWPDQIRKEDVRSVFFYGAGCLKDAGIKIIRSLLVKEFENASLSIHSDLEGAALSTLGNKAGVVAILGTGSSTALWSGSKIEKVSPSLGYLLGDEGSAADLGKFFIRDLIYGNCPENLQLLFQSTFGYSAIDALTHIYSAPHPGQVLGRYASLLIQNKDIAYVQELVTERFQAFLMHHLEEFSSRSIIGLNGSIAFYFEEILMDLLRDMGFMEIIICRSPLHDLIRYHQK